MKVEEISFTLRIKHMWLIKLINYPLLLVGLPAYVPSFCVEVELPK